MKKTILKISLTCLIVRVVLFCTTFGAVCAENTTTTQTLQQVMQNGNVYDLMSYVSRKYASFPDYWGGSPITGWSYDAYAQWLEEKGLSSQLQEEVTVSEGASGGRSYNIPQNLRETMVQYVQESYINENPLSYTQCYIYSYNFLNPNNFSNVNAFNNAKAILKNSPGWSFTIVPNGWGTGSQNNLYIVTVDRSKFDVNFIGTTTAGGFTNVSLEHNWAQGFQWPNNTDGIDFYMVRLSSGQVGHGKTPDAAAQAAGYSSSYRPGTASITNTSSAMPTSGSINVFSNLPKNEMVYVFQTLNAYKNYNAGYGQQYYLPTGSTLQVPYNDPFTDDDLYRAGNYYNNIVDNSQSGWTAEQILSLVDKILGVGGSGGTNNAGTGNDDDSFSLGFLGKIGEVLTSVTGAINPVQDLVEDGIKKFLEDIFGWLPPEIVTLWIAGITFAVFFGILRVIRG